MDTLRFERIALIEFADIVEGVYLVGRKLRILIKNEGFVDAWNSGDERNRYKYHWVRNEEKGIIYRHDNAPDARWVHVATYPKHFHKGSEGNVVESYLSDNPEQALRDFLLFVRETVT